MMELMLTDKIMMLEPTHFRKIEINGLLTISSYSEEMNEEYNRVKYK